MYVLPQLNNKNSPQKFEKVSWIKGKYEANHSPGDHCSGSNQNVGLWMTDVWETLDFYLRAHQFRYRLWSQAAWARVPALYLPLCDLGQVTAPL